MPRNISSHLGILYIVISAFAFGAMAIFARAAYASGANVSGVLLFRFFVAALLLWLYALAIRAPLPRGRTLWVCLGMGAIGYAGQALAYFSALEHASAGLVALLLYLYPALVAVLAAIFLREKLHDKGLVLLILSFVGTILTVGGGQGRAVGALLGVSAALIYAIYIVVGARFLKNVNALISTTLVCSAAAFTIMLYGLIQPPSLPTTPLGWSALLAIVIISTVVAILTFFAGLKRVGANRAAMLSTLEPVVTVGLAFAFLQESLTAAQLVGGALILGVAVALAKTRG